MSDIQNWEFSNTADPGSSENTEQAKNKKKQKNKNKTKLYLGIFFKLQKIESNAEYRQKYRI